MASKHRSYEMIPMESNKEPLLLRITGNKEQPLTTESDPLDAKVQAKSHRKFLILLFILVIVIIISVFVGIFVSNYTGKVGNNKRK